MSDNKDNVKCSSTRTGGRGSSAIDSDYFLRSRVAFQAEHLQRDVGEVKRDALEGSQEVELRGQTSQLQDGGDVGWRGQRPAEGASQIRDATIIELAVPDTCSLVSGCENNMQFEGVGADRVSVLSPAIGEV